MTSPPPTIDSLTDRELITRYVSLHDEIAFAALVRRHSSLILGICHRVLGHRQDVEDAFQATFLVLARDAHRVRKRESLASWLHGVAYRTSLRAAESRHRRIRLLQDVTMIEDSSLAEVELRHQRQLLDEELENLPEKYRAPLILHYLEGQTAQQVAQTLKLSTSTVEGRLKRGRKELHLRLVRRGLGLSIAVAALSATPQLVTAAETSTLVGNTIHAGLSYTAGDPAGPLFTHEAARLAAQETLAMTLTTTTATVTALILIPIAVTMSNHNTTSEILMTESTSQIVTAVGQEPEPTAVLLGASRRAICYGGSFGGRRGRHDHYSGE
ncbi:MAG: sigma-70 family RNA polymerase sigma factor [Planctomycetaceae bacterium]